MSKPSKIEQEIITLLGNKDHRAIGLLYRHYANSLYGLIFRIIPEEQAAEEVLQDVFVKVWKHSGNYQVNKGRLYTWLANISRNSAIDHLRSQKNNIRKKTDSLDTFVYEDKNWSEVQKADHSDLQRILNSLDEKSQQLLSLVYLQGYSHQEVAKHTGLPLGTVKTRIRSAISALREKLDPETIKKILFTLLITTLLIL